MALPRKVQEQVDAAEALLTQANAPVTPSAENTVDLASLAANPPQPPAPAPETVAPPVANEPPAPAKPLKPAPDETWEARFNSLRGLFDQQVPLLQGQVRDLSAKYQDAVATVDKLSKQVSAPPAAPATPTLDPKDAENFGQDLVDMVMRVTNSALAGVAQKVDSVVSEMEERLVKLESGVKGAAQSAAFSAEQTFFDRLAKAVPEWEQLNGDTQFLAWLGEVDPIYGAPRQSGLNQAQANLDAVRAAAVFNAFKATRPQTQAAAQAPLDKQVSPRSTGSAPPPANEKPTLSQKQIVDFYDSLRKGGFAGRETEARNIEAAINQAIAEGRVR